jgi:hypothetical protein
MSPYERSFEEEVLERLAVIALKVEELPALKARVTKLELHRSWLAGVMAAVTAAGGVTSYLHFFKV